MMMNTDEKKWYDKTWLVILLVLLLPPVGLYGLWKNGVIETQWKYVVTAVLLFFGIYSSIPDPKWEYYSTCDEGSVESEFKSKYFSNGYSGTVDLDVAGSGGWELVDVYELTETAHPNFGNDEYVTGIQPNVRTEQVCYVFKRRAGWF
jgi:hypothetical protein